MLTIDSVFGAGGRLSKVMRSPEVRNGQVEMAQAVHDTLEGGKCMAFEAPTGTGKSLACLVPAAMYAKAHKERVVIATHTLALQEQLVSKDAPTLQQLVAPDLDVKVVVLKGRSNYVCAYKVREADKPWFRPTFNSFATATLYQRVVDYIRYNDVTEKDEVPAHVAHMTPEIWDPIKNDGDSCLGQQCPAFWQCSYFKAVREAQKADIIIANHALVFTDLVMKAEGAEGGGILPAYAALIMDEAHHLEESATKAWSKEIGSRRFEMVARAINDAARKLGSKKKGADQFSQLGVALSEIGRRWLDSLPVGAATSPVGSAQEITDLWGLLERILFFYDGALLTDDQKIAIEACKKKMDELKTDVQAWCQQSRQGYAYWVTVDGRGEKTAEMAPIDVSETLKVHLFCTDSPKIICTSATLQDTMLARTGFPAPEVRRVQSPFDYRNNALLYVPRDALGPKDPGFEAYVISECRQIVDVCGGRTLILFTARDQLNRVHAQLAPQIESLGYRVLKQDDMPKRELIRAFKEDRTSVLMGLASFWEGIDVPGESCVSVVLVKLPFSVPSDPLTVARSEAVKKKGGDPFDTLFLPDAVVRFQQGFGRLIRTKTDYGVVACLDPRLVDSRYGQAFRRAVSEVPGTRSLDKVKALLIRAS